ncbi:MAG: imidazole glycerol phosphate synthase subunit HisH [Ruminococcaceae bacterium]|nr:imidazole glycerol phosphate synthase subunit HisH [Oscillospiraceae bacterium]
MIAIVDYGVGNLYSLRSSLEVLGLESVVTHEADALSAADQVILPGVGAFGDAMEKLNQTGLAEVVRSLAKQGKPLLGICLGMQLLFNTSHEFGLHQGLGLISGEICPLEDDLRAAGFSYKVPHMGWNPLRFIKQNCPLLKASEAGEYVYYVHSYYAKYCDSSLVATSEYGVAVPGVVQAGKVFGTQFHPEKSGAVGLRMLKAFSEVR